MVSLSDNDLWIIVNYMFSHSAKSQEDSHHQIPIKSHETLFFIPSKLQQPIKPINLLKFTMKVSAFLNPMVPMVPMVPWPPSHLVVLGLLSGRPPFSGPSWTSRKVLRITQGTALPVRWRLGALGLLDKNMDGWRNGWVREIREIREII